MNKKLIMLCITFGCININKGMIKNIGFLSKVKFSFWGSITGYISYKLLKAKNEQLPQSIEVKTAEIEDKKDEILSVENNSGANNMSGQVNNKPIEHVEHENENEKSLLSNFYNAGD